MIAGDEDDTPAFTVTLGIARALSMSIDFASRRRAALAFLIIFYLVLGELPYPRQRSRGIEGIHRRWLQKTTATDAARDRTKADDAHAPGRLDDPDEATNSPTHHGKLYPYK
ncbi:hypothetical protein EVAR_63744_1 [Eumeta japonica]|uniref:Uncharacterized protein n=1 Tax=Eumeta variegata TaxID=151549 RepID=A0A4C1ZPX7_EUMVA|nr:hypothetical protein EVAR_63744_1 [Eumeta japonica]